MQETLELMSFHLCVAPPRASRRATSSRTKQKKTLVGVVSERHKLDSLLLEHANRLFDRQLEEMRALKRQGYGCNLQRALGQSQPCGLLCSKPTDGAVAPCGQKANSWLVAVIDSWSFWIFMVGVLVSCLACLVLI